MISKNEYFYPLKKEEIMAIPTHSPAHTGKLKFAVDFTCDEGSKIYAALDGEIVWVKEDSNVGGPDKKYYFDGNRIVIKHKNKEYSAYEHLKYNGVTVKVGDKVKAGDLIGYSGNTGMSWGPHLHFEIFIFNGPNKEKDFQTIRVRWKENVSTSS